MWELPAVDGSERVLKIAHADHELARARIAREADALAAIGEAVLRSGGRAVPQLFERGVTHGRAWMVMERVRGENLADATLDGPLRVDRATTTTMAILESVEQVHRAGFAHRDLKPDNLIRTADGRVVVLDLGIARKLPTDPDDPTRAGVQIGSLEYMPPEQAADPASVDARSDLYAVGCILFELCTGRPPFVGDAAALERAHAALRPPRLGELAAVPAVLEALVHDVLAKDPAKRPSSATELRAKLSASRDADAHPSMMRTTPAVSHVTESKQPVVLVWAELPKVDRALLGMFSARHVIVASQRGRKILGALLGSTHGDPASAALALAQDLAAAGARVACHLDALHVDKSSGTPMPKGEAIERVESWLPAHTWTGVVLTRALASVAQVATRSTPLGEVFRAIATGTEQADAVELVGRGALLVDIAADAAAAMRGAPSATERSSSGIWSPTGPAFALLYGDAGTGKTAFAAELAKRVATLGARVHSASVPAPGMGKRGPLEELVGAIRGVRELGDALRALSRTQPLAILLDDLHFADAELLDALEYATLGGEALPLWILGIADPRLETRRPQLGARAERRRRDTLPSLDEEAAVELTTRLLEPAQYPPLRAVRRIVALARGNPLHLTMLAREIHERGAIRPRPGSTEFFLDTSALDSLEPIALGPWIAARAIAGLAPEVVALARACAVIGGPFAPSKLVAVIDAVEAAGGPTTTMDPEVGLKELLAASLLVEAGGKVAFRQALVEEGLYATTDDAAKHAFHAAALVHEQLEGGDPARIARHAEAVGESAAASAAFALLGGQAEHAYRPLEAEQAWSGAIRHLAERAEPRARALLGLARARMRLQRLLDARAVLDEALAIAREIDDARLEVELALEQAIVLDFCEDFDGARANAALAGQRLAAVHDDNLRIDLDLAIGRDRFRRQQYEEAAAVFVDVLARARAAKRHETATIAALLLGPALSDLGRLDEAERVFDQLVADCIAHDDRFHLAAAYGNRAWLWSARGEIDRTAEDLRRASQLARESGQAMVERSVVHNLSEQMLWEGKLDEALQLARRGLSLQSRAAEGGTLLDRVLLARVLAARGELIELREVLGSLVGEPVGEGDLANAKALEVLAALANDGSADVWEKALDGTEAVFLQLRLELWLLAARHGRLSDTRTTIARELAAADPLWRRRIHEL